MTRVAWLVAVITVGAALGGCDGTGPRPVAGTYVLESVSGRGATDGSFVLTAQGFAARRARYRSAIEYIATGTFTVDGDTIRFALRDDEGRSQYVWNVRGTFQGSRFNIRYPDPADGPDIVETYRHR